MVSAQLSLAVEERYVVSHCLASRIGRHVLDVYTFSANGAIKMLRPRPDSCTRCPTMGRREKTPLAAWLDRHPEHTVDDLAAAMASHRRESAAWRRDDRRRFFSWYRDGVRVPNKANQTMLAEVTGGLTNGRDAICADEWRPLRGGWRWRRVPDRAATHD